jgi:hypothetical protein
LWSYQRVFFGEITQEKNRTLLDASVREKWILATMAVVTLWMGIGSTYITRRTAAAAQNVIDQVELQRPYEASVPSRVVPSAGSLQAARDSSRAAKPISFERLATR